MVWRAYGAPKMRGDQLAEVIGQLGGREVIDLEVKVRAHAPDDVGVGVNGLGLQRLAVGGG